MVTLNPNPSSEFVSVYEVAKFGGATINPVWSAITNVDSTSGTLLLVGMSTSLAINTVVVLVGH